jgi:hypothetical protein
MTYHVAGIGREYITLSGTGKDSAIRVDKNGVDKHIEIAEEMICVEHKSWNMFDQKEREYYCPHCHE